MDKYMVRFMFEYGGVCLWGMNKLAKEHYGYAIDLNTLPLSKDLKEKLNSMQEEFETIIDWDNPLNPSLWTECHKIDFVKRANLVCIELAIELGFEFEIINENG